MMLILSTTNENKYYDDKATCSREQEFNEFALSMNMSPTVRALQRKLKRLGTSLMF